MKKERESILLKILCKPAYVYTCRTEWVQMKEMFKGLQKEHMKQIKSEISKLPTMKSEPSSSSKGFVKNCLLRVELEQAWEESGRDNLKVRMCMHVDISGHFKFINRIFVDNLEELLTLT